MFEGVTEASRASEAIGASEAIRVDFTFSDDQDALRAGVRGFLEVEAPNAYVRAMAEDARGCTDAFWAQLAELGWPGLLIPEEHGGLGLGLVDMVVVMEEMGRLPLPGPYFSSAVSATLAARHIGAEELLPALASGAVRGTVALEETPAEPVGRRGDHAAAWRRVVDDGGAMLCAELVGSCDAALALAVEYAKVRVQFDRPIATFQAIRHKAVDMLHRVELARVGTHYAAWASHVDDPARESAVAMVKGYVGEAAVFVTSEDIQIHGGVGFTWDCDAHFFYKRAKQNDVMLGYQGWHRQRVADLVLDPS